MRQSLIALLVIIVLCSGCASKDQPPRAQADSNWNSAQEPPLTGETYFASGIFAESQGNIARAVAQYEQCLAVEPKHEQALYRLAVLRTQAKQYPQAIEAWKQYLAATNRSAAAYSNLALAYELAGKRADAEAAYRAGIDADPDYVACRVNYGLMLARTGRTDEALAQFESVLTPAEACYNIASIFEQQGKTDEARTWYRAALEKNPTFTDARTRLAALN
jgi:tetratricopeptide (TPR) repeat protein